MPILAIGRLNAARRDACEATDLPCTSPCCFETAISNSSSSISMSTEVASGTTSATSCAGPFMDNAKSSTYLARLMDGKRSRSRSQGQSSTMC
eukprot:1848012-Karenia_brevis.AAC.1